MPKMGGQKNGRAKKWEGKKMRGQKNERAKINGCRNRGSIHRQLALPWGIIQMLTEKLKSPNSMDRMRAVEPLDRGLIWYPQTCSVHPSHFGKLQSDALVGSHPIGMPTFDHERTRCYQSCHLCIIELAPKIKLEDFVLHGPNVTIRCRGARVFPNPIVEVC